MTTALDAAVLAAVRAGCRSASRITVALAGRDDRYRPDELLAVDREDVQAALERRGSRTGTRTSPVDFYRMKLQAGGIHVPRDLLPCEARVGGES